MNTLICNPVSVPGLPPDHGRVFTTNWHVIQACQSRGIQAVQLEDVLTIEMSNRIDAFVYGILYSWFQHDDKDFTRIEGVSLGLAHADDVYHGNLYPTEAFTTTRGIAPFIKWLVLFQQLFENNPDSIAHDLDPCSVRDALELLATHKRVKLTSISPNAPVETSSAKPGASPLQQVKQRVKPIYRWLKSVSKSTPRNRIAIIPYSCFDKLRTELHHHNIGTMELTLGELPYITPVSVPGIHDAWKRVQADTGYCQRFQFDGIDCQKWFLSHFTQIIQTKFPQSMATVLGIQRFLKKRKLHGLVVPYDSPCFASLCVQTANQLQIPTLYVQHGVFGSSYSDNWEFRSARNLAVLNQYEREHAQLINPTAHITEIGCIQTDRYTRSPIHSVLSGPLRVLVLTYAPSSGTSAIKASGSEQYMIDVVAVLSQITRSLEITFKLHPSEKVERYERILAMNRPSHTHRIESGWSLPQLLTECDLVIAPVSTGIIEAVALGKPAILFHRMIEPKPVVYAPEHGLPVAETVDQLSNILQTVARDYDAYYQQYPFERFLSLFKPSQGSVFERVARIVEQWIPEGQR